MMVTYVRLRNIAAEAPIASLRASETLTAARRQDRYQERISGQQSVYVAPNMCNGSHTTAIKSKRILEQRSGARTDVHGAHDQIASI